MFLAQHRRVAIGKFSHRQAAEYALGKLKNAGFLLAQISIVAKYADCEAQLDGTGMSDCTGDEAIAEAATGAIAGGMLGAILGCLAGLGMLAVPGVGFLLAAGTAGTALATTLAGAGIGAASGSLISALACLETDSGRARVECDRAQQGEFLVMVVVGTDKEVRRAESILNRSGSSKVWAC